MAVLEVRAPVLDSPLVIVGDDIATQCCECGAITTTTGYIGQGALVMKLGPYRVSHGICPKCYRRVMGAYRARQD